MEQVPPNSRDVGEDPDPEDHDHAGRELATDAELVAEVDDRGRDHHVAEERDHEHLVVEDPVEVGPQPAEHGVERGDDRDREGRLESGGHGRLQDQPEGERDQQPERGDHGVFTLSSCEGWFVSSVRRRTARSFRGRAAGSVIESSLLISYTNPKVSLREYQRWPNVLSRRLAAKVSGSPMT